ncbi:MAG: cation acetate symporter, partial [Mycolicibacterium sp.]
MTGSPLTAAALLAAAVATIAIGAYGVRFSRTTSDFLVASRTVGSRWNAAAISGEYLSAASFLGVAGLIAKYGADALWYPVGFTAGYLGLLLFVAAPLRRSGAYTVPDFAEFRLGSPRLRKVAMLVVVVICIFYLVPQYQGAGLALKTLLGVPVWLGPLAVGAIVIMNVVAGGMRSITFVQAFQYWLKLTAVAIPALALAGLFLTDRGGELGGPLPPTVQQITTVEIETDVVVQVAEPAGITVTGTLDDRQVDGAPIGPAGDHTLGAGSTLTLSAGAATPVVAGTPSAGRDWISSGGGLGGRHPLYQVLSIMVATFLGTMGLPHVLVRFYTNPDGRAARRTALAVIALLSLFYLFPTLLGVFSRLYVPQLLITGTADAAVLLAPGSVIAGVAGQLLAALVAAGAIAAFLATSSGLLVSFAGALASDVLPGRVRDFRVAAVIGGLIPIPLA